MALTPEQVKKYRQEYGFEAPAGGGGSSTPVATGEAPESRIQRLKAGVQSQSAPVTPSAPNLPPQGQNGPTTEPKKSVFGKIADFGLDLAKDAAETLLVKPAARTAEALGRTGVFGTNIKRGYEEMADTGQDIAGFHVEPVKTGVEGAKQIAGEGLKSASWLYGGQGTGKVLSSVLGRKTGSAILTGAATGAVSGGAYGAGDALERNEGMTDVLKEGAIGGALGALGGGTVAAVPGLVRGGTALTKGLIKGGKNALGALDDAGARAAELATRTPAAKKAINAGIDDTIVSFAESAKPKDQRAFLEMFDLAEKGAKDLRFRTLPKQVAGRTILDRAGHVIKVKDMSVAQTNRVLDSLDQAPADQSKLLVKFLADLREKGITVVKRGKGYQFASHGNVPEGDLGAYRSMLNILAPDENGKVMRSFRGLHTGRQRIFNELNLAKARQQTFSDDVVRYADQFRSMLLDPIDKASKGKYKASQQKTAESLGALRDLVQLMGYKGDLEKLTTKDLRAGEIATRILGNASERPTSAIQALDDVARKYGYKGEDSVIDQITWADLLENVFGTKQTTSLKGQVGRGALDAASEVTGAATDAASGNILALGGRAIKAMIGKSKDDQIIALKELLQSLGKARTNFGR